MVYLLFHVTYSATGNIVAIAPEIPLGDFSLFVTKT